MDQLLISHVPLFASLAPSELNELAVTLRPARFPASVVLFREGDHGDRFYVILEGEIEVIKALDTAEEKLLSVRGAGEYLGEMGLLSGDRLRTASVRTRTPVELLEMTHADFNALLYRQPVVAYELMRALSARLNQVQSATIRDLQEKNRELAQAYQDLQAAQAQIVEKEKLERELEVALQVQVSLLPRGTPKLPGWEFAARWQPARYVAGDFYDFIPLNRAQALEPAHGLGIVIADVSDKGMPAALFMALSRSTIRASLGHARSPAESIGQSNRLICADAVNGTFVTLFYAQLDPRSGELTYVNAGHNPPLFYRAAQDELTELANTGMALGLFDTVQFEQRCVQLAAGDFVLMYTDGVTEAMDTQHREFGEARLRRLVLEHQRASAAELATALEQALADFIGLRTPSDDITVVVAKRL
ncbi:MAG TPA: SpoIIE family protein phosphatase [Anaerolineae bacterium]|nr:SpoIIE family protein phosphatase [Anaerolineae bacterium]